MMSYLLLFLSALLAATLIPAQSEALLVSLMLQGEAVLWVLLVVATLGNTLGSVINWWLGRYLEHFQDKRWFPVKEASLARAQQWFQRYGWGVLLLSWLPIIGDPLTVVAGVMRMPLLPFVVVVAVAKGGRYGVLAWMVL
ncbi:YqaA family protein [Thiothrix subterranea]|uniref:YqaA family protein n=1 Tax=Thiothrix subterranea TaxID=2735563 RepID=A0AA51MRE9_9GAMM|nr:YqaA family protein [Thiothrix subterranea]MDQ5770606.1 YqaA family protein [Thiothrix subterranea]WML86911.1 YqaA family protein [Thiothrix subterranea]